MKATLLLLPIITLASCVQTPKISRSAVAENVVDGKAQWIKGNYGAPYAYLGNKVVSFPDGFIINLVSIRRVRNDQRESNFEPMMLDGMYHDLEVRDANTQLIARLYMTPHMMAPASFTYNGKQFEFSKSPTDEKQFICKPL